MICDTANNKASRNEENAANAEFIALARNALRNIWRAIERKDAQQAIRITIGSAQLKAEREAPPETMFKETSSRHRLMLKAAIESAIKELAELKAALLLND